MSDNVIEVGAKVRRKGWHHDAYVEVRAVEDGEMWVRHRNGEHTTSVVNDIWERYVEPPTVIAVWNLYDTEIGSLRPNRAAADEAVIDGCGREAVLTRYSDGSWTVEDVR